MSSSAPLTPAAAASFCQDGAIRMRLSQCVRNAPTAAEDLPVLDEVQTAASALHAAVSRVASPSLLDVTAAAAEAANSSIILNDTSSNATPASQHPLIENNAEESESRLNERMNIVLSSSAFFRASNAFGNSWLFDNYLKANYDEIIYKPPPIGHKILCKVIRKKKGKSGFNEYEAYLECSNGSRLFLFGAIKKSGIKNEYLVAKRDKNTTYTEQIKNNQLCAKVKSTFLGLKFSLMKVAHQENSASGKEELHEEIGEVLYERNFLGLNGPRKMTIRIPSMKTAASVPMFPACNESNTDNSCHKLSAKRLIELKNKPPQWNEETQSYVLNFNGRVSMASVKNFQVVHDDDLDYIVLQFGRLSPNMFSMDYQYPLNALQAFGICLTSFDGKLACE